MLVVTRRTSESVTIEPMKGVDPNTTLSEAFEFGPIEITVLKTGRSRTSLAISAPSQLKIWRELPAASQLQDDKSKDGKQEAPIPTPERLGRP